MNPFVSKSRQNHRAWLVAGIGASFALLGVGLMAGMSIYAERKTEQVIQYFERQTGLKVSIKNYGYGLGRAHFEGITLMKDSASAISRITAAVNLNPLAPGFGRPGAIEIHHLYAKTSLANFQAMLHSGSGNVVDAGPGERGKLDVFNDPRLPGVIRLGHSTFILTDDKRRDVFELRGLELGFDRGVGILSFHFDALVYKRKVLLENISGQVITASRGRAYPFLVSRTDGDQGRLWQAKGELSKDLTGFKVFLKNKGIPGEWLPFVKDYLVQPDNLRYAAKISIASDRYKKGFFFGIHLGTANIVLRHDVISTEPVGPIPLRLRLTGHFLPEQEAVDIRQGLAVIKPLPGAAGPETPVAVQFEANKTDILERKGSSPWHVFARMPMTSCQSVLDAIPPGLAPRLASFELSGDVGFALDFQVSPSAPAAFSYNVHHARFGCRTTATDYEFTRERLMTSVVNRSLTPRDQPQIAQNSAAYVPLAEISPHVLTAFVATEDAGFWRHRGIQFGSLEAALRRNLEAKGVVVGGSTISMQTAKNLYLSQERTLSRKLQELFLTWHLERIATKNKILEIYANIIEYGPGILGIKAAAEHYFAKQPRDLSLVEAAFLASLLPAPTRRYEQYCQGQVSTDYRQMLNRNLQRMLGLGLVKQEAYIEALNTPLVFDPTARTTAGECQRRLARVATEPTVQ